MTTAHCCRAMMFPALPTKGAVERHMRQAMAWAEEGCRHSADALLLLSMLEPLPDDRRRWSHEERQIILDVAGKINPTTTYWRCHALVDGRCSIHAQRPGICREFRPGPDRCATCGCWDGQGCRPA